MSPRPSPSQTQAPRTGCSPQQDNHTARCTHRFSPQAVYAHLEDSGRKADVTLAGGGLPARKRTARPRLTRMWSTWARLRRWTRSFRWGYDERPRHNAQTDRVLDLLQRNSTGAFPIEAERHVVENLPASSGSVRTRRDGALASTRGKASAIRYVTESPGLDCFQLPRPRAQLTDEQLDALEKLVLQLGGRQKRIAPAASEAVVDVAPAESEPDSSPKDWL